MRLIENLSARDGLVVQLSDSEFEAIMEGLADSPEYPERISDEERKKHWRSMMAIWRRWHSVKFVADEPMSHLRIADVLAEQFGREV